MTTIAPDLAAADAATVHAATVDLDADITHLREQTRAADAKAGTSLTVVGLVIAAATAVLPRLGGAGLALAAIALVLVVLAGAVLGLAVAPRPRRAVSRTPDQMLDRALQRAGEPRRVLVDRAAEAVLLGDVVFVKHRLLQTALGLLGLAFVMATTAAVTVAVAALL